MAIIPLARLVSGSIGLLIMSSIVSGVPNTNQTTVLCNSGLYTKGDPFASSLAYVLADLEDATPSQKGYNYYNISPFPVAFAYGHASCTPILSSADCSTCLVVAKQAMLTTCPNNIGSRSVLYDCAIRYEQYPFTE